MSDMLQRKTQLYVKLQLVPKLLPEIGMDLKWVLRNVHRPALLLCTALALSVNEVTGKRSIG